MSDPISVIATIVAAATGAVDNSELPDDAKVSVRAAVQSGGDAAMSLTVQLDNAVAQLPEPAQQVARQGIGDAIDRVAAMVPSNVPVTQPDTRTVLPEAEADTYDSQPLPVAGITTPSSNPTQYAIGPAHFATVPVSSASAVPVASGGNIATFVPWFRQAGGLCPGIKAPTLAALYAAENGFRYGPTAPVSPAGALGPGQFMPATWAIYGKDVHGDGIADVFDVGDSVMASGHLLCDTYREIESWKLSGLVTGDTLDLTLAAYNAGAGAVLRSGGMPSGSPDYEHQTKPYVARIRATEEHYGWLLAPEDSLRHAEDNLHHAADLGRRIIDQAMKYLGIPYVWGGGGSSGPTLGGFDCSGLTSFAVHAASGGAVSLPRTSQTQWQIGTEIPLSEAAPGDLLFGNWGPGGPGHVAIYLGNGQMIHAPTPGDVVRISPIMNDMQARRVR
ncbi:NlpC/P60 family protein [Nocardia sp. NBC_00565]|uniref:C40 family peptidase n=1 Tax=Nocardia sp. NBC_00565 TaxID=2975993 RepID=UPI002E81F86E|nr:NlpC/P60 family protein [Nocardia sp. NBC_00565]WUC06701.1 NlpC/P60 family protein [Nocardia sp. NBC_00565]